MGCHAYPDDRLILSKGNSIPLSSSTENELITGGEMKIFILFQAPQSSVSPTC